MLSVFVYIAGHKKGVPQDETPTGKEEHPMKIPFISRKKYERDINQLQQEKTELKRIIPRLVAEQTEEERKKLNEFISRLSRVSLEQPDSSRNLYLRTKIDGRLFRNMTDLNEFGHLADHVSRCLRSDMYKLLISGGSDV